MHQNLRNLEHSKTPRLGLERFNLRWKPGGAFCFLAHLQCFAFIPKACPSAECNKKVIEEGHGAYRCEKCNKTYPDFKYRLMLLVSVKWHLIAEDCGVLKFFGDWVHHIIVSRGVSSTNYDHIRAARCHVTFATNEIKNDWINENSEVNTWNQVVRARQSFCANEWLAGYFGFDWFTNQNKTELQHVPLIKVEPQLSGQLCQGLENIVSKILYCKNTAHSY